MNIYKKTKTVLILRDVVSGEIWVVCNLKALCLQVTAFYADIAAGST